jgi:hypothetical protein
MGINSFEESLHARVFIKLVAVPPAFWKMSFYTHSMLSATYIVNLINNYFSVAFCK